MGHQVLQRLLRGPIGQSPDGREPARVAEFFAVFVERFHHAVGKEDQRIAGIQLFGRGVIRRRGLNAKGHASDVEFFQVAIGAAQNRCVVAGVHVTQAARSGFILGKNGGGKAPAVEAVRAGVAIEADHQIRE